MKLLKLIILYFISIFFNNISYNYGDLFIMKKEDINTSISYINYHDYYNISKYKTKT